MKKLSLILFSGGLVAGLYLFSTGDDLRAPKNAAAEASPAVTVPRAESRPAPVEPPVAARESERTRFTELAAATLRTLPRTSDVREKRHRNSTFAPPELLKASAPLGEIASAIAADESLVPAGIEFYRACALQSDYLIAVRALCLRDLKFLSRKIENAEPVRNSDFPDDVVRVAATLPPPV